jgi:selenophosphate synthase
MTANRPNADGARNRPERADTTSEAAHGIETLPTVCGCAGKTALDRIVFPALVRIRDRTGPGILLPDAVDAALLPRTSDLDRDVAAVTLDGSRPPAVGDEGPTWTLSATFANRRLGSSTDRFTEAVGPTYAALADDDSGATGRHVVGKGHAVQLAGATMGRQWFEHLRPVGERRPGYRAANVDVVHAFPGLEPERQAEIAVLNALNDCYATGATAERSVRPLVATPDRSAPSADRVRAWYGTAVPPDVTVNAPALVEHDGRGWLFGATATAAGSGTPALRPSAVEPGDAVLVHRPLGGLALLSHAADDRGDGVKSANGSARRTALAALTSDHRAVARALAEFRLDQGERFDPDRHLKLVTDVSGPGVAGVGRALGPEYGLRLTDLPLLDRAALERARDRWVVPDVTVETNGPLAVVAQPGVARAVDETLATLDGAAPGRLGTVRERDTDDPPVTVADGVPAGRYVERLAGGGSR